MEKILYFDCAYGISGDMTLGAFLDLGVEAAALHRELKKVPFEGYKLRCTQVYRHGVPAKKVDVVLDLDNSENKAEKNPDDVQKLIKISSLSADVKQKALRMFQILAQAQAKAHQIPLEKVHFHEKGAVDSLVDVIGTAICLELLGISKIYSTPLNDGTGFIQCRCGSLAVPVPATRIITQQFDIPTKSLPIESELVTPTGAAIAAALITDYCEKAPVNAALVKTGVGAGDYDYGQGGYLKCSMFTYGPV